ncbi:hypothetical protein JHV56_01400 [Arthrobacter sp. BHU FT2]|nr:hypothetical protein [Arthrobacter sp. BHU FT2]
MPGQGTEGAAFACEDDGGEPPAGPGFRAVARAGVEDFRAGLRTLPFWAAAAGTACATWAVAGIMVWLVGVTEGDPAGWVGGGQFTAALASMLLPVAAALLGMQWGLGGVRRIGGRGEQAAAAFPAMIAAALRGLVFSLLVLAGLSLHAAVAGVPGGVALYAAGVAAVEGALFGGMGAGLGVLVRQPAIAAAAGWLVALLLVVGAVAAAMSLVPVVRSEEPVTVALNVERATDGTPVAYTCSRVPAGSAEVYRTERIMWLPAASPAVVLVMLVGDSGGGQQLHGWLATELQRAADGTQVPCVNGEPRSRDAAHVPLPAVGLLLQAALAGSLLAGAHAAESRRRTSS